MGREVKKNSTGTINRLVSMLLPVMTGFWRRKKIVNPDLGWEKNGRAGP